MEMIKDDIKNVLNYEKDKILTEKRQKLKIAINNNKKNIALFKS